MAKIMIKINHVNVFKTLWASWLLYEIFGSNPYVVKYRMLHLQAKKLLAVSSNIWGTKFRIQGMASYMPEDLGSVHYKTSLFHLQVIHYGILFFKGAGGGKFSSEKYF